MRFLWAGVICASYVISSTLAADQVWCTTPVSKRGPFICDGNPVSHNSGTSQGCGKRCAARSNARAYTFISPTESRSALCVCCSAFELQPWTRDDVLPETFKKCPPPRILEHPPKFGDSYNRDDVYLWIIS
eukprot:87951_1